MTDKKKFKDTKVGKFLSEKAPKILDTVGDVLPEKGVLGIVKNLIDKSDELTPQDKEIAMAHLRQSFELEVKDRDSARIREVEVAKVHNVDFLFYLTGFIGLGLFCFIVYAIAFLKIPEENKETWIQLIGLVEGVILSIFGYYFGSSVKRNVHP